MTAQLRGMSTTHGCGVGAWAQTWCENSWHAGRIPKSYKALQSNGDTLECKTYTAGRSHLTPTTKQQHRDAHKTEKCLPTPRAASFATPPGHNLPYDSQQHNKHPIPREAHICICMCAPGLLHSQPMTRTGWCGCSMHARKPLPPSSTA